MADDVFAGRAEQVLRCVPAGHVGGCELGGLRPLGVAVTNGAGDGRLPSSRTLGGWRGSRPASGSGSDARPEGCRGRSSLDFVGRGPDWLKKIETGVRPLNSMPLLIELARALGTEDLSELTGSDVSTPVRAWEEDVHHAVPAIREAMREVSFAPPASDSGPPALSGEDVDRRVERLWTRCDRGRRRLRCPRSPRTGNSTRRGRLPETSGRCTCGRPRYFDTFRAPCGPHA